MNATFSKVNSVVIENGKRILKVFQFGAKTGKESAPFGIDGSPLPEMTAIYAQTSNISESVVIGYINKNQLAAPGEVRMYALDSNGSLQAYVWAHGNGELDLNGNEFTAVRYALLNAGLQQEVLKINAELVKIAAGIQAAGGTYTPEFITLDISGAESEKVKLQ